MLSLYHQRVKPQVYQAQFKSNSNIRLAQAEGDARKEKALDPIREKMGDLQYGRQQRNLDVQMFQQTLSLGKLAYNVYDNYKTAKEANELSSANLEVQQLLQGASDLIKLNPNQSVDYAQSLDEKGNVVRGKKSEELYNQALKKGEGLKGLNKTKFEQSLYSNFSQFQNSVDTIDMSETLEIANTNYKEFYKSTLESPGSIEEKLAQHKDYLNNSVEAGIITRSTAQKLDLDFADKAETRAFSNMADNLIGADGSGDLSLFEEQVRNSKYLSEEQENEIIANAHEIKEARVKDAILKKEAETQKLIEADLHEKEDKLKKGTLTQEEVINSVSHSYEHAKKHNQYLNILNAEADKVRKKKTNLEVNNPELFGSLSDAIFNKFTSKGEARNIVHDTFDKQKMLPDEKQDMNYEDLLYFEGLIKKKEEDPQATSYILDIGDFYKTRRKGNDEESASIYSRINEERAINELYDLRGDYIYDCVTKGIEPNKEELDRLSTQYIKNLKRDDVFDYISMTSKVTDKDIKDSVYGSGLSKRNNYTHLERVVDDINNGGMRLASPSTQRNATVFLKGCFKEILKEKNMELGKIEQNPDLSLKFKIKGSDKWHRFAVVNKTLQLQESLDGTNYSRLEFEEKAKGESFKSGNKYTGGRVETKDIKTILTKDQQKEIKTRILTIDDKYRDKGDIGKQAYKHELTKLASEYGLGVMDWSYDETVEILEQLTSHERSMRLNNWNGRYAFEEGR